VRNTFRDALIIDRIRPSYRMGRMMERSSITLWTVRLSLRETARDSHPDRKALVSGCLAGRRPGGGRSGSGSDRGAAEDGVAVVEDRGLTAGDATGRCAQPDPERLTVEMRGGRVNLAVRP